MGIEAKRKELGIRREAGGWQLVNIARIAADNRLEGRDGGRNADADITDGEGRLSRDNARRPRCLLRCIDKLDKVWKGLYAGACVLGGVGGG